MQGVREDRNPTRDERWALHKRAFCHRVPQARVRESILCLRCRKVDAIHTLIGRSPAPNLLKVLRVKKEMFYGPLAAGAKLSRVFNLVLLSTWPYLVGRGKSRLLRSASVRFEVFLSVVTLLARFPDPLNEASRLDEHRSISAFVWRCCLATS